MNSAQQRAIDASTRILSGTAVLTSKAVWVTAASHVGAAKLNPPVGLHAGDRPFTELGLALGRLDADAMIQCLKTHDPDGKRLALPFFASMLAPSELAAPLVAFFETAPRQRFRMDLLTGTSDPERLESVGWRCAGQGDLPATLVGMYLRGWRPRPGDPPLERYLSSTSAPSKHADALIWLTATQDLERADALLRSSLERHAARDLSFGAEAILTRLDDTERVADWVHLGGPEWLRGPAAVGPLSEALCEVAEEWLESSSVEKIVAATRALACGEPNDLLERGLSRLSEMLKDSQMPELVEMGLSYQFRHGDPVQAESSRELALRYMPAVYEPVPAIRDRLDVFCTPASQLRWADTESGHH